MDLQAILERHALWLAGEGGERANLHGADLCGADLGHADLCGADLRHADLYGAHLRSVNLRSANLCSANLGHANLRRANLCGANLRGANLRRANLCGANLGHADFRGADLGGTGVIRLYTSYEVTAYPDGRLTYGCETHTLEEWEALAGELSERHEPKRAAEFEAEIRAILALVRVRTTGPLTSRVGLV